MGLTQLPGYGSRLTLEHTVHPVLVCESVKIAKNKKRDMQATKNLRNNEKVG